MKQKAYAAAGVDIDLGNRVKATLPQLLASTHRPEVLGKVGGFGGLFALDVKKYREPVLVSSTDGVGTKLKLAFAMDRHDTIGEDLVNHCVDDIAVLGREMAERLGAFEVFQRLETKAPFRFTSFSGQDPTKPLPYNPQDSIPTQIRSSISKSLANLHTSYLDAYLLHSPLRTLPLTIEAWRTLMTAQDEGTVRAIGISNVYDVGVLKELDTRLAAGISGCPSSVTSKVPCCVPA